MTQITIHGSAVWTATRKDDKWFAVCPILALNHQSPTLEELYSSIDLRTKEFLSLTHDDGDLQDFLEHRGWSCTGDLTDPDPVFHLPWVLIIPGNT